MKLVREAGGEAIADTSWSILTESGDIVRESVGAFASMVLAEGNYAVVAKNRDRLYQREFTVEAGRNRDVEVIATGSGKLSALAGRPASAQWPPSSRSPFSRISGMMMSSSSSRCRASIATRRSFSLA